MGVELGILYQEHFSLSFSNRAISVMFQISSAVIEEENILFNDALNTFYL